MAQEDSGNADFTTSSLNSLLGNWAITITYANGAVATGSRQCAPALSGAYIRCGTSVTFNDDNATERDSIAYYNFNPRRKVFEEISLWQFPAGKKLTDYKGDPASGKLIGRGFVYNGEAGLSRRSADEWIIGDDSMTFSVKSNRLSEPADVWSLFIEEKMTRQE